MIGVVTKRSSTYQQKSLEEDSIVDRCSSSTENMIILVCTLAAGLLMAVSFSW